MSTQARTKNDLSSDEINNYSVAHFIVSDALSLCREKLLAQEVNAEDPASQDNFRAARSNIEANLELMKAIRLRFNDGRSKVLPPDTELIRSLALGSAKVAGFACDPARLPEIMELTGEIISKFQALQEL
ncbi:MAG: hypothetical protein ABIP88_05870 [Candidatus Binatia bacterium]